MSEPASGLPVVGDDLPVLYEDDDVPFYRQPAYAEDELPLLYEDEGQEDMGETRPHNLVETILQFALTAHFAARPGHEVLADMNLYFHPKDKWSYVSPDVMVVTPPVRLPTNLRWYRIGETGPAPVLVVEVLSRRTARQGDMTHKPRLYASLGVSEYLLIDATEVFLPERLLLLSLDPNTRTWSDSRDQGDGVVSRFGFRVAFDRDDLPRVSDTASGWVYPRPDEADEIARSAAAAEQARSAAEARVRELEAELARLRNPPPGS